jgi:hypothetical protein
VVNHHLDIEDEDADASMRTALAAGDAMKVVIRPAAAAG